MIASSGSSTLPARAHQPVACGEFGAAMQVRLVNDGPVTIPITLR